MIIIFHVQTEVWIEICPKAMNSFNWPFSSMEFSFQKMLICAEDRNETTRSFIKMTKGRTKRQWKLDAVNSMCNGNDYFWFYCLFKILPFVIRCSNWWMNAHMINCSMCWCREKNSVLLLQTITTNFEIISLLTLFFVVINYHPIFFFTISLTYRMHEAIEIVKMKSTREKKWSAEIW